VAVPLRMSGRRKASPIGVTQCGVQRVYGRKHIFANPQEQKCNGECAYDVVSYLHGETRIARSEPGVL
jgi:hypothetical protein